MHAFEISYLQYQAPRPFYLLLPPLEMVSHISTACLITFCLHLAVLVLICHPKKLLQTSVRAVNKLLQRLPPRGLSGLRLSEFVQISEFF